MANLHLRQRLPCRCWKAFLFQRRSIPGVRLQGVQQTRLRSSLHSTLVGGSRCSRSLHLSSASGSPPSEHSSVTVEVGESPLTFSTGKYVKLADGAILVESGETSVMVTAVSEKNSSTSGFGMPLQVDYRERASATNRIPLTFFRRELRATSSEILVSRFIDRSIRPLFPRGYTYNTQVICNMLAVDRRHDPEILSINGASAALAVSDIPWNGPIGAVRIGLVDDEFIVNPSRKMLNSSKLNIVVAATADRIVMVEGSANEVSEDHFCEAVHLGFKEAQPLISSLYELQQKVNRQSREAPLHLPPPETVDMAKSMCGDNVKSILLDSSHKKISRDTLLFASLDQLKAQVHDSHPLVTDRQIGDAFWDHVARESMRSVVLDHQQRCDGRGVTDLRPISCEVDVFKPLHGSSIFTRGETQVFCSVTFDSPRSAYRPNLLSLILGGPKNQSFMVHYEFPPFATNTTGLFLGMGRREIGHGCLAEKALAPLMPTSYPFTVRVNAQVLESNGSSSMATVCGGSLALFDAGVPMPHPVAGVACGLFTRTKPDSNDIEQYQILTDINGIEDALGNMDFKIAGTRSGITAAQVDIKGMTGLPFHIFEEAMMQSKDARYRVLDKMDELMSAPREGIKENGPAYAVFNVPMEKRGKLIGAGGHRIKAIAEETETVVESVNEEMMSIFAPSQEAMEEARERVDAILNEAETKALDVQIGSVVEVVVKDIRDYGFMVELAPGVLSLLHVAQLSHDFISYPMESGINIGDKLNVKFLGRDSQGRYLISRKALLPLPAERTGPRTRSRTRSSSSVAPAHNFEVGSELEGMITEERDYGFLLELAPGVTTLLHNTQIDHTPISHPSLSGFKIGDKVKVLLEGHDAQGRLLVSRKPLLPPPSPPPSSNVSAESGNGTTNPHARVRPHPSMSTHNFDNGGSSLSSLESMTSSDQQSSSCTTTATSLRTNYKRPVLHKGSVVDVTIKEIKDYGFKVEVAQGVVLLLHLSEISRDYITDMSQTGFKIGDKLSVKVLGRDRLGRTLISRKALLPRLRSNPNTLTDEKHQDKKKGTEAAAVGGGSDS